MSARVRLGIVPEEDEVVDKNQEGNDDNSETDNVLNVID